MYRKQPATYRYKCNHINNSIRCKWSEHPPQKGIYCRIVNKSKTQSYAFYKTFTRNIKQFVAEKKNKMYHESINQKKAGMAMWMNNRPRILQNK